MNAENIAHFDSFKFEYIPNNIRNFIGNENIMKNIYRIQGYDSVMCRYCCIGFIDFMLKYKSFLE